MSQKTSVFVFKFPNLFIILFRFGALAAVGCWIGFNFVWYIVYAIYRLVVEPKMYGAPSVEAQDRPGSRLPLVETSCSSPTYGTGTVHIINILRIKLYSLISL